MSDKRAILRKLPPFATLSDADCDALLAVVRARKGMPGDVLFAEGDASTSLLVVLEGSLLIRARGTDGGAFEIARIGRGEVVGELAALDPAPRNATVSARAETLVIEVSREALAQLRRDAPFVAAAIHRVVLSDVARRLRAVNVRAERQLDGAAGRGAGRPSRAPASRAQGPQLSAAQLRGLPALREYGDADLELLSRASALRVLAPKEVLFEEDAPADCCWVLLDGEVDVVRRTNDKVRILASLRGGALVGQLALVDRSPRSATVIASMQTHALELGKEVFERLLHAQSPMALRFQEQIAIAGIRQLRRATARLVALMEQRNDADAYMHQGRSAAGDWDPMFDANEQVLELAVDPKSLRR